MPEKSKNPTQYLFTQKLIKAIEEDDNESANEAIRNSADLHEPIKSKESIFFGYTPLQAAIFQGNINIASELINFGANIKCVGANGFTLMHLIAWKPESKVRNFVQSFYQSPYRTFNECSNHTQCLNNCFDTHIDGEWTCFCCFCKQIKKLKGKLII